MPERTIAIEEAFSIIKRVYAHFGWNPGAGSSREQRNAWFASAVAVVHYGHPTFNPAGGDARWCIKDAGGGRPQSDDIIVDRNTREYFDLMPNAGADGWSWNLGRHSEPLPAEQNVYPPSKASLPPGGVVSDPDPGPGPGPGPGNDGRIEDELQQVAVALGNVHARLDGITETQRQLVAAFQGLVQSQPSGISGEQMARLESVIADQSAAVLRQVVEQLGKKIEGIQEAQCVLRRR